MFELEHGGYEKTTEEDHDKDILSNLKLPRYNSNCDKNYNIMGNQLFYNQKDIDSSKPVILRENEKDRELRLLEQAIHYKLDKKYMNKLTDLLQQKHDKKYSLKRKYIHETVYTVDEKKNMHLTLSEDFKSKGVLKKQKKKEGKKEEVLTPVPQRKENKFEGKIKKTDIKGVKPVVIPKENNTRDSDSNEKDGKTEKDENNKHNPKLWESEEEEQEGNENDRHNLFEKGRTKSKLCLSTTQNVELINNNSIPNLGRNNGTNLLLTSIPYITSTTESNNKISIKKRYNHRSQEELFFKDGNIGEDIDKIREKNLIIKKMKNIGSKKLLHSVDLFHCDKIKFQKILDKLNMRNKKRVKTRKRTTGYFVKTRRQSKANSSEDEFAILKSGNADILNNMKLKSYNGVEESKECELIKEDILKKDFRAISFKVPKKSRLKVNILSSSNSKTPAFKKSLTGLPLGKNKNNFKGNTDKNKVI